MISPPHTQDFNHERYSKCIEVHLVVKQKQKEISSIEWKIVRKVFCDTKSNYCLFCLKEKHFTFNYPHEDMLINKRSELISKCRHENKNMLANIGNSGKINNDSID